MDINQIRDDTPGCEDKLFLNSAGSSLMPKPVVRKTIDYLLEEEKIGGYKLIELQSEGVDQFYSQTAQLLQTQSRNIAFAFNATEAYARALSTLHFLPGDVIVTSQDDYVSNQIFFITMRDRMGVEYRFIRNLTNGDLDLDHAETLIESVQPKLVAITHMPTNSGLIQDVEAIGDICSRFNIWYLVDACQTAGQLPLDVKRIKCDFLSASGRKFLRGPRGTGFLYLSDRVLDTGQFPMYMDLAGASLNSADTYAIVDSSRRFETWELPYALIIGLKEAIKYANEIGMQEIYSRNQHLSKRLRENLLSLPGVELFDRGSKQGSIITFRKDGKDQKETKDVLDQHKLFHSMSGKSYAFIDFEEKGVEWVVRLSPHYFNTIEEIDAAAHVIEEL